jgi:hypothetical protein
MEGQRHRRPERQKKERCHTVWAALPATTCGRFALSASGSKEYHARNSRVGERLSSAEVRVNLWRKIEKDRTFQHLQRSEVKRLDLGEF